ncbi:MAG: tetratricopeptide repeat protein [Elusimicrobia bacterium]|nr:tetratricopeptide repeat protein [Elusimicrobiota bacterium]
MKRFMLIAVSAVLLAGRALADDAPIKADVTAKGEVKGEPAAEAPAAKSEAKAEPAVEAPAVKSEAKTESAVETPAAKSEAKAEPAAKGKVKNEPAVEAPAAKSEVQAEPAAKGEVMGEPAAEAPAPKGKVKSKPAAKAPAPEPEAASEPVPAPAPAPAVKVFSAEERLNAEWTYLKDAASDATAGVPTADADDLAAFIQRHPDAPMMGEAQLLLASLYQKQGDAKPAMVALLRYLYEHPGAKAEIKAKSNLLELGDKTLSRQLRSALGDLVKVPETADNSERLATMLQRVVDGLGDVFFDATVTEIRRYQVRYPDSLRLDSVQMSLGQLYEKNRKYPAALLAYQKVITVYSESPLYPAAQFAVGRIYADDFGDYKKAIEVYQDLAEKYPQSPHALTALQRTAQLLSEKLKQYEIALQIDEKIVKSFPKSDGALKALNDEALLLRDRLNKPTEAVDAFRRLAEKSQGVSAVQAYQNAAAVAKDAKEFKLEIEMRSAIANYFPDAKEAAQELFAAGEVYENSMHDLEGAIKEYKLVAQKFPTSKYKKKADEKLSKLDK